MTTTQYRAIELAIVPRAARVPADFTALLATAPMQHTFRHFGSLNVRMTDHIADMISETLGLQGRPLNEIDRTA